MKSHSKGMTLVEVMIYAALLSFILASLIQYFYVINLQELRLRQEIDEKR